ncbi:MAG: porin family protein [Alphaproteobacteria bacterium]|nr:porin family protein [Alphaproteobacteria bacterium]
MKKVLVGLSALLIASGIGMAGDCTSGGKKCGCKPKKYRVIYVTAHNPDTMYDNSIFEEQEVGPDYRMVPIETSAAMQDRRATYEEDDKYYDDEYASDDYDDEYDNHSRSSTGLKGGYVGARVGVDLLTWKNKYSAEPESAIADFDSDHDKYTFEPVFGGNVFAGLYVNPAVRADLEVGYISQFSDSDNGFSFKLSAPYVTLNGYYDFLGGFYIGLGAGVAFPKATMDWQWFVANSARKTRTTFTGALMLGYERYLSDHVVLDFRYRLSGFEGPKWTRGVKQPEYQSASGSDLSSIGIKTGFILDNAFTVGLRFEF